MRILMLGNSYTFYNNLPAKLATLTGAEVVHHTHGGARLSEHLNAKTEMGRKTLTALQDETWDYVVLQEMSNGSITARKTFLSNMSRLCGKIHAVGAVPVLFATWAYRRDNPKLSKMNISYDVMAAGISEVYHEAAEQGDALVADVGLAFYNIDRDGQNPGAHNALYAADGSHPSEAGTQLAANTIASVILKDRQAQSERKAPSTLPQVSATDPRLRILYLYKLLKQYTDPDHSLSTNQIRAIMEEKYGLTMHRTTVPSDVALLQAAGIPIHAKRSSVMLYHMEDTEFEIPELKILIDAVESSKFITVSKCRRLVDKLTSLTSIHNAEKLRRNLHISGRVRSGNEKGYYIVDAINDAINERLQISFLYTEYNEKKQLILRNDGKPYIVSPFMLIWNGDFYYLVGYYHEKNRVSTFRVDRILMQPEILENPAAPIPEDFDIAHYTREVFRMYDNQEQQQVTIVCENSVMKGVIDQFGTDTSVKKVDKEHFSTKVNVCTSPTFYAWVFQWRGAVRIAGPESVQKEYEEMAKHACLSKSTLVVN